MRIIITGATGFLGGVLARRLLAQGDDVIALGRDRVKLASLEALDARTHAFDLSATAKPPGLAADAIVHCAALSSPWGARAAFHAANVIGTQNAIKLARDAGARRFVHISTPSIYFRFRDQVGVREDAELPAPVNAYAQTKREAERLVIGASGLDPIILRPRGLYGPGDTTLLPRLINAARTRALPLMNEGRAATDLTFITDVADAAHAALIAPGALEQRIFNISGGEALNVTQVADRAAARANVSVRWRRMPPAFVLAFARLSEALCARLPHRPEPPITAYGAALFAFTQTLNIEAAAKHLGWTPKVKFDEGLALTFAGAGA
ncbi:MAG: NAD(P)-dependent oxidoreductase [Hyphomonadaceae bacterium]|nr:NAD(P)-dependent oxidoreductase [Hyphomonadaceae bacterium]